MLYFNKLKLSDFVKKKTSPTSLPWWWTGQSQSCWSHCSRTWWSCGRNPVFLIFHIFLVFMFIFVAGALFFLYFIFFWFYLCLCRRSPVFLAALAALYLPLGVVFSQCHFRNCGFCLSRILPYFPVCVCPSVCHRRDISTLWCFRPYKPYIFWKLLVQGLSKLILPSVL